MSRVECIDLTKRYGEALAVDRVNLTVEEGEFLVIVGPSGCGKTTTLRMIAGLESISDGELRIDGKLVNKVEPRHRDIAMVFQNYALYPHKKVYDNIAYPLQLRRVPKQEIRRRVTETASLLGIERLLERRIRQLSGGERQRVALGRAIVRQPRLFLMDEPLSNLDAQLRIQMRREIIHLQRQLNITTVYVTHDQVEAMTMGHRIVVMRDGLVQQVGDPMTLYNKPANRFVARFIGSPPMNIFDGALESAPGGGDGALVLRTAFASFRLPGPMRDRLASALAGANGALPVVCGLRAEDIAVQTGETGSGGDGLGVVDIVEPLGSDVYVSVTMGEETLLVRAAPDLPVQVRDHVRLLPILDKLHLFDPQSEVNLLAA